MAILARPVISSVIPPYVLALTPKAKLVVRVPLQDASVTQASMVLSAKLNVIQPRPVTARELVPLMVPVYATPPITQILVFIQALLAL